MNRTNPLISFAGPYFTYLAGSNHEHGHASEAWDAVPTCVTTSRKIVEELIHEQLENLTVLAWYAPGNRKVRYLPLSPPLFEYRLTSYVLP